MSSLEEVFSNNLKYYMELNHKSRFNVCNDLMLRYTTFADWYNGKIYPRMDKIELLANYFHIKKSDLIEEKNNNPIQPENHSIENFFTIKVSEDSMSPIFMKDDIITVQKQNDFNDGDIVAVILNGKETLIRKVRKSKNNILLQAFNPVYEPLIFTQEEIEKFVITIIGVVKQLKRNF